jgi:mevalonate kinase
VNALKVIAKAPGKVIITGEHFVVHGSYALVSSIDRFVTAIVEPYEYNVIESMDLGLSTKPENPEGPLMPIAVAISPLLDDSPYKLKVSIKSELPISAGLGSSAASSVAVVKAVVEFLDLNLSDKELFDLAMRGEREVHKNPSGIDVSISLLGGFLLFKRDGNVKEVIPKKEVRLAICNTGLNRNTGVMVAKVSSFKDFRPKLFGSMVDMASSVSLEAADSLERGDLLRLGRLMNFNHEMLRLVNASTRELDELVYSTRELCYGSKLTGAGGGGCTIHLIDPDKEETLLNFLSEKCHRSFMVRAGVKGARSWKA